MIPGGNKSRRRAMSVVWAGVMMALLVAFLGMAVDIANIGYTAQRLQAAADAASLAGAARVKTDTGEARQEAQTIGAANTAGTTNGTGDPVNLDLNAANDPNGDIVVGRWYRWDDDTVDPPRSAGEFDDTATEGINAVKVVARRTDGSLNGSLPMIFGQIFGVDTANVARDSIAVAAGSTGAGLIVLCPDCECALEFGGTTQLTLATAPGYDGDASIIVDSNATGCSPNNAAVCGGGNSLLIDAPEINIVAEGPESSCWNGNPDLPPLNPGSPYVPDPLAGLPEPSIDPASDLGCIGKAGCTSACNGGASNGAVCDSDADCLPDPGTCSATGFTCNGGPNGGNTCTVDADCAEAVSCDPVALTCTGGPAAGTPCAVDSDCANWTCSDVVMTCIDGPFVGAACATNDDCTNSGTCGGALVSCLGGVNNGYACMDHGDCPGGQCMSARKECHEGANAGLACTNPGDCPGGSCVTTVRAKDGYYSGGFRLNSSTEKLILDPGVYSLDDNNGGPAAGLVVNGGNFIAHGVMLHIAGDAEVDLAGNGTIEISAITDPTHLYWGVSIFQSRSNFNEARIIGTNNMSLEGTYYFPMNGVEIGGEGIALGNQLIAWTMYMHGTGTYTILYDGENPAPGYKVFLVR